MKKKNR